MKNTKTFLLSAFSVLIIFVLIGDWTKLIFEMIKENFPDDSVKYEVIIKIFVTLSLIALIALLFAFLESMFLDRSASKYAAVFSDLTGSIGEVASRMDLTRNEKSYWAGEIDDILSIIYRSFSNNRAESIRGSMFSSSIMDVAGDKLHVKFYKPSDSLFEPGARDYQFAMGEGYCGVSWEKDYPQSGRKRRRFTVDERFHDPNNPNNKARSFFSTRFHSPSSNIYVLNISSNHKGDFMWYQRHAESVHYSLQPTVSLLKLCLHKWEQGTE